MKTIKKRIKRSLETIQESANKFQKRSDWAKEDNANYKAAKKRSDYEQIVAHMKASATKPYTLEEIKIAAKKYQKRSDFQKYDNSKYQAAVKRPDYEEITIHMDSSITKAYTLEEIQKIANKYTRRGDFKKGDSAVYNSAWNRPDFEQICIHMDLPTNKPYTFEEIKEKAKECKNKGELYKKYPSVYNIILKRRDREEIISHMPNRVDQSGENNPMYGRTVDGSPAFKWSKDLIKEEADKHERRIDFALSNPTVYNVARKRDDYEEIVAHMMRCSNSSKPEIDILELVKKFWPKAQKFMDRKVKIENKPHIHGFEIDIYIPELRKGIEFDGKFYHGFKGLKRGRPNWPDEDIHRYHELKDKWFLSKNIALLHINGKDWENNKEICIQNIMNFIKL
jgi:hypothetical protein